MKIQAEILLKEMLGNDAEFHLGQFEAIESVLNRKKTLVVQKTGWGKSIVYFIATKILRDNGGGITLLVSPLLSLMRNQVESAKKIGIKAETINSENPDDWEAIEEAVRLNQCDILLISPEKLASDRFRKLLTDLQAGIGLLVVDEAHCISNWGHDFRPNYKRIVNIVSFLPSNVPLLATTATANNRVVQDIAAQLGNQMNIIRGPLTRESLSIQSIRLTSQAERLAWLAENIPKLEGSGIIYCLTIADCKKVAKWLVSRGIDAEAYHSKVKEGNGIDRVELEDKLMNDQIKVLVSTDALGMGFDKSNLAFVIHFQRPSSVISYYQQIGRAGRALKDAFAILLSGDGDNEIQDYFINSAFPSESQMNEIVQEFDKATQGMSVYDVLKLVNMSKGKVDKCLNLLEVDNIIYKLESKYHRSATPWLYNQNADLVTQQRRYELQRMDDLSTINECYMRFVALELDDDSAVDCGRCANCLGRELLPSNVSKEMAANAIQHLCGEYLIVKVKKRWPNGGVGQMRGNINPEYLNGEGRSLSLYGDAGWGKLVKEDRYQNGYFRDELVNAAAEFIISTWGLSTKIDWVTAVPSLRNPMLVPSFAETLAHKLGVPFYNQIIKTHQTEEQKYMKNSSKQASNIASAFEVLTDCPQGNVLLVDDIMNSGWTFTVCGMLLQQAGSGAVYPFALAATAGGSDMD